MNPKRVALYIRVSSAQQVDDGYGLDFQKRDLEQLVQFKSHNDGWFTKPEWLFVDEGISGATMNRPAFQKMMKMVQKKKFDVVAVWKIDRMSRSLSDLLKTFEELQQHGVNFYSLKEGMDFGKGAIGTLTLQLLGSLSQYEKSMIKARTAEGRLASAKAGNIPGRSLPYGYKRDEKAEKKTVTIIKEEAEWVHQIFMWFYFDKMNFNQIANRLNQLKVDKGLLANKRSKNTPWTGHRIKGMLQNSSYSGNYSATIKNSDGVPQTVLIPIEPIIATDLFENTQLRIEDVANGNKSKGRKSTRFLLSRKIYDTESGKRYVGYKRSKDAKISYRRQKHTAPDGTVFLNMEVPAKPLEESIKRLISDIVIRPEDLYAKYVEAHITNDNRVKIVTEFNHVLHQKEQLESREAAIHEDYFAGTISAEMRQKLLERHEESLKNVNKQFERIEQQKLAFDFLEKSKIQMHEFAKILKERIHTLSQSEWKRLIGVIIEKIELTKDETKWKGKVFLALQREIEVHNKDKCEPIFDLRLAEKSTSTKQSCVRGNRSDYIPQLICFKIYIPRRQRDRKTK